MSKTIQLDMFAKVKMYAQRLKVLAEDYGSDERVKQYDLLSDALGDFANDLETLTEQVDRALQTAREDEFLATQKQRRGF